MNIANAVYNFEEEEEEEEEEDYDIDANYNDDDEEEDDYTGYIDCYEAYNEDILDEYYQSELTEKFSKLVKMLEDCIENEQKQIIDEMNGLMDEMDDEEFDSLFTKETFDALDKMIEEKKLTMENAILLMKHKGYCKILKNLWNNSYDFSLLSLRIEKMIFEEDKKKEEKDEKLLIDLCECYVMMYQHSIPYKLLQICVPCLVKAASNNEENEKTKEEVEMALLALSNIDRYEV
ncbi:uncharacterized protein MONOS_2562 [Monocercomonoides exilis]|uniref:uncharacterized protein n=1 Tax=Monocercomonoides exilis TaxID=2049356 RepID=UPI003559DFF4|nr:hypothetical protein MONOS_2562 [Monocercomonoides exilis]|eukprot:MONOS_2562.1-p1 / transcript=MONOS_2562.1 / gene=MONOS_2562 / organism=Monocercomonoides_exilis_PA203 / gene_product=unspecified product / transcript_product=unspecified product / location=Mono_scaffold00053:141546-142314(-) / protein_length=234 / sequence_SO=supercontig / SO=protein_coding / is_pseudo=false